MAATPARSYRIARLSLGYPPRRDGLSHHVHLLSRYQSRRGHQVVVFVPHGPNESDDGMTIQPVTAGSRRLDPRRRRDRWQFGWLAARLVVAEHGRDPFHVIHCHGDVSDVLTVSRAARKLGIPVVLTLHAGLSRHPVYRRLAPMAFRSVTRFIAVGRQVRDDVVGLGVSAGRVSVITSGIEYHRWASASSNRSSERRRLGLPTDAVVAVAVGRLHPMKGFEYLAAAAAQLPTHLAVVIVGDGPLRDSLSAVAGRGRNLILLGNRPHGEIPAILAAADIFVLPSVDLPRQAEGTPTALLEAMATGLPAVVTDSGGGHHLVSEAGGGLVVAQRDPDGLANALVTLAGDPGGREAMGGRNRQAARRHDWPAIADLVDDVYHAARDDLGLR